MPELAQLLRNIAFLMENDLTDDKKERQMADKTLNDVVDSIKGTADKLVQLLPALIDDDQMQKDRADALQAAAVALDASGNVVDASHADVLRGLADALNPVLALLTPAAPADPDPATETPDPASAAANPAPVTGPAPGDVQ